MGGLRIQKAIVLCGIVVAGGPPAHAEQACLYNGNRFSIGATLCECPQLTVNGSEYLVLQRRLTCGDTGEWQATPDQTYKHCLALGFDTQAAAMEVLVGARSDSCLQTPAAKPQDAND